MCAAPTPTVADVTVHVTFVDSSGNRRRVPGRVGSTLLDMARMHKLPMDVNTNVSAPSSVKQSDIWTEDLYGEGPHSSHSHVLISPEWVDKVPEPLSAEQTRLEVMDEDLLTPNSRLGECITLTKELDGLVVSLPEMPPTDIP